MARSLSRPQPTSDTQVLRMLAQRATITEVLNQICDFAGTELPGVIPAFLLPDCDGRLRLAAGPRVPRIRIEAFEGLPLSCCASFQKSPGRDGEPVPIVDMKVDPSFTDCWASAVSQGIQGAWLAPVLSKEKGILGTLILFRPTPLPPGGRDLELIEQVIHMATIAIECHRKEEEMRGLFRRLYQSEDAERHRIARELHDSAGQTLALLAMNLSTLEDRMTAAKRYKVLSQCSSLVANISDELRTVSRLLHPPVLDECGLNAAIRCYVSRINQGKGLHVEVESPQELPRLSEEAELAVFRIVQSALTNVHLHSRATEAKVKIGRTVDGVVVEISDEGQGIPDSVLDHSSPTSAAGLGITGMRERAMQLGGCLEIETSRNGTTVTATIPKRHFRASA